MLQRASEIIDKMTNARENEKGNPLADKTKVNYINRVKRLEGFDVDIFGKQETILEQIAQIPNLGYETFKDFIMTIYNIRRDAGIPNQLISKYKLTLKVNYEKDVVNKKPGQKVLLPQFTEVAHYVDGLHCRREWIKYIINYILLVYNTRNQDLDAIVTNVEPTDNTQNYLFITGDKVIYTRNQYKTYSFYGQLNIEITDPAFVYACKQYLGERSAVYLLVTSDGQHIKESSIGSYIQTRTFKKIGQKKLFNMVATDTGKYGLLRLEQNRGTQISTILQTYDLGSH
jgi:hypothetical protein